MIWGYLLRIGATILAVLTVVGIIYGKGRIDANHAREMKQLEQALSTERKARQADAYKALAASKRMGQLSTKIRDMEDYVDQLEDANAVCLSRTDTDSLRHLWAE